jgi:dihydrofolate reductase
MRKIIAGMRSSLDGKIGGPDGYADWVETWADNYEIMPRVDACLLGAGMYPGYEQYWSAIKTDPSQILPMTGRRPTLDEVEYAQFAARTPSYVLSSTLASSAWPTTTFIRRLDEVRALKEQAGKDIYLVGGAKTVAALLDAGLVDELRLAIHPLIVGPGKALFEHTGARRSLELRSVQQLPGGCVSLNYAVG